MKKFWKSSGNVYKSGVSEMKPKIKLKICIDILMTAALLFLMPYELVGRAAHEWIGTEIFLLFILHHILNRKWTAHMFKGKYTKFRILQTILVAAIFISMIYLCFHLLWDYFYQYDREHGKRYSVVRICICSYKNQRRCKYGEKYSYALCLLGIYPDVSASGTTLEHVSQDA